VENFFKVHSCAYKNGSREQNHPHFRDEDLSYLWQDLIWSPFVQNLRALASAIPEIWMGHPKFKVSRDVTTPLSGTVCHPSAGTN